MAQETNHIIEILEKLTTENTTRYYGIKELTSGIENELKLLKNKDTSALFKLYCNGLIDSVAESYSITSSAFRDIEKKLKKIYSQEAKNDEENNLPENVFTRDADNFYKLAASAKTTLKELRNGTKNIPGIINPKLKDLNRTYNEILKMAVSSLETIFQGLESREWKNDEDIIKEQYENIVAAIDSILEFIEVQTTKHSVQQKLIFNLVTAENLKITKSVIGKIIKKSRQIDRTAGSEGDIPNQVSESKKIDSCINEIFVKSDDIKQALGEITRNIDSMPDMSAFKEYLRIIYNDLESISKELNTEKSGGNSGMTLKLANFIEDFSMIRNIVNDLYEALETRIIASTENFPEDKDAPSLKEQVKKILSNPPQKELINSILSGKPVKKEGFLNKLVENTNNINQESEISVGGSLSAEAEKTYDSEIDAALSNLYGKNMNNNWVENATAKNTSENLQTETDVSKVLKTTERIVEKLELLTNNPPSRQEEITLEIKSDIEDLRSELINSCKNTSSTDYDKLLSKLYEIKPIDYTEKFENLRKEIIDSQQEKSEEVLGRLAQVGSELNNDIEIEAAKNEITGNQAKIQENIISKLAELDSAIANAVSTNDFALFAKDLKAILNQIVEGTKSNSQFEDLRKDISNRLNNIDFSYLTNYMEKHFDNIKEIFSQKSLPENHNDLNNKLTELKKLVESQKTCSQEVLENSIIGVIEKYFNEIKSLLTSSNSGISEETIKKIGEVEKQISDYKTYGQKQFEQILQKLAESELSINNHGNEFWDNFKSSAEEISSIREQIENLSRSFGNIISDTEPDNGTADFISKKLDEIGGNLEELNENIKDGLQHGFTYNSELVEEKTTILLDVIKELRHSSTENVGLFERLTVADNKLMDLKQELELVNTDVTNVFNSKTDAILSTLESVKDAVKNIADKANSSGKEVLNSVKDLLKDAKSLPAVSGGEVISLNDDFEKFYNDITQNLQETRNDIRDFLLSDIDSVIIKVDNIKDYLTDRLDSIVPPNPEEMKELNKFISQVKNFKKENEKYFARIEKSINENIDKKHDELKSMVAVALNNDKILSAIADLKKSFITKLKKLKNIQNDDFDSISAESEESPEIVEDMKEEFKEFSQQMNSLSAQSTDIEYILNQISERLNEIGVNSNLGDKEDLSGVRAFDFIKAFELLSEDIKKIKNATEEIIKYNNKQSSLTVETTASKVALAVEKILSSSQKDWLDEIKNYIGNEELKTIADEVNNKMDILVLTSNQNDDNISGIKKQLDTLNTKVDVLASSDNYAELEDIKASLESINISAPDNEIKDIIETINSKIDIVADSIDSKDVLSSSDYYSDIEGIKASLEILSTSASAKDIQKTIETINSKIDIIAESIDSKDVLSSSDYYSDIEDIKASLETLSTSASTKDIQKTIETINSKIDIIADSIDSKDVLSSSDYYSDIEGIKASLESINTSAPDKDIKNTIDTINSKIDIIVESNNTYDSDIQITSMLETLNHKIDIIAETDTDIEREGDIEEIKSLILQQKDFIDNLKPNEKLDTFKKCLDELSAKVNNFKDNGNEDIKQTLKDMKSSIMDAVVSIFSQVSFVEESEDIKDFVEEKTDILAKNLEEVTKQIKQISSSDDSQDYSYSMQDIETDLAKLRIALNEIQHSTLDARAGELTNIADTLGRITSVVDSLSQEEIQGLKDDIVNLKDQTRQLLLSSDASFSTLNNDIIYKVDNVTQMLEKSSDSDKVMRQALIYIGEWIDSASESMNKISSNSDEILNIKSSIEENFTQQHEHIGYIEKQISKLENLEARFEQQEARIDKLEENLDKILSIVEDMDTGAIMRKIEKLDKQISKLGSNVEKLTSYVD